MSKVDRQQQAGFEALLKPHLDRLYRLSFRLSGTRPAAEDLFQDVLTKVFSRLDELADIEEPAPWLCRVMYNHFIDHRRRLLRERLTLVSESQLPGEGLYALPGGTGPDVSAERLDNIKRLDSALSALSDEHRLVVLLHDSEGYKLPEIQAITGLPLGTLKSRLHRARARLRELLVADGTISAG